MKRTFFFVVMAALSFSSCRKDDSVCLQQTGDIIGFSTYLEQSRTKAGVTDVTGDNLTSFKVMAYLHDTHAAYFKATQTATKQSSGSLSGYFRTDTAYYWPDGHSLDFVAWNGSGVGAVSNTGGVASLTYTVPSAGDVDFVVAYETDKQKQGSSASLSSQPLTFSHALSKINSVTLMANDDGYSNDEHYKFIFTDVRISDAKNKATYTLDDEGDHTWGTPEDTTADYVFTEHSGDFLGNVSKKLQHASGVDDSFVILPQKAIISVTYSVSHSADGSTLWSEVMSSVTKSAYVDMEKGESYDITLKLTNDVSPILFSDIEVEEWNSGTETLTPVPFYIEDGTNYGPGIEVHGLFWAPVNCGIGANYKYPYGLLYQWGRMDGQDYDGTTTLDGPVSEADSSTFYTGSSWFSGTLPSTWPSGTQSGGIGNPCPAGWRVPTKEEWSDLKVIPSFTPSVVTKTLGTTTVYGSYFNGTSSPGTGTGYVFLPAAGCRSGSGSADKRGDDSYYWADSCSNSDGKPDGTSYITLFPGCYNNGNISSSASYGYSVRCVH